MLREAPYKCSDTMQYNKLNITNSKPVCVLYQVKPIPLSRHLGAQLIDSDGIGNRIPEPSSGMPIGCSQIRSSLAKEMEDS